MWTINLLPASQLAKRRTDRLNYYTLLGGVTIVTGAIILAGVLLLVDQIYVLNLNSLQAQKAQAESQAALYLDVEKKAQGLEEQLAGLQKAQGQSTQWAALLKELQAVTPPNVSVKSIALKQAPGAANKTDVTGAADSRRNLGQFQLALAGSSLFKNVEIVSSNQGSGGVIEYKITLEVNYDKLNRAAK